jgi:hypothetical protein
MTTQHTTTGAADTTAAQHTHGPWAIARCGENDPKPCGVYSEAVATGMICSIPTQHESAKANAHLIAAAPELLNAARLANEELLALGVGSSASLALRALWSAISKAEGRA